MFALAPGSFMFIAGFLASFVDDDNSPMGAFLLLIAVISVLAMFATFVKPAGFMKPRWIRAIDEELKDDPLADLRRREILRRIRPPLDRSMVRQRLLRTLGRRSTWRRGRSR